MSAYTAAVLAAKPTLYWQLNETAGSTTVADSSGNGLSGSVGSAITLGTQALVGSDARTSATIAAGANTTTKLIASAQSALMQPSAAVSVEWVGRLSAVPASNEFWVSCGMVPATDATGYAVYVTSTGALVFDLNSTAVVTSSALTVGVSYHIACTWDGITARIYLNGVLNASAAYSTPITGYDGTHGFVTGNAYTADPALACLTQDVAVYAGSVLSSTTVAQHAALAAGYLTTPYEQAVLAASPALFWPLGDAPGSPTVKDYGPNNLPGTVGSALTLGSTALVARDATTSLLMPGNIADSSVVNVSSSYSPAYLKPAQLTAEAIIKVNAYPTHSTGLMVLGGNAGTTYGFYWYMATSGVLGVYFNANAGTLITSSAALTIGNTYHVAISADGSFLRMFINGAVSGNVVAFGALTAYDTVNGLIVGDNYAYSDSVHLNVSNVALYPTALLPATIAQHAALAGLEATSIAPVSAGARISTPYIAAVLADTPVGFWRLDDPATATTIADLSGNNISGAWQTGVTRRATGLLASEPNDPATSFPSGAYAANKLLSMLTGPIALLQPTNSFSCDFMLSLSSAAASYTIFVGSVTPTASAYPFAIGVNASNQIAVFLNTSGPTLLSTALALNTTYHIGVIYDRTTLRIYINGVQNASVAYSTALTGYSNAPFAIGDQYTSRTGEAAYTIGQVAFYSQALSAARVLAHYQAGFGTITTQSLGGGARIVATQGAPIAAGGRITATSNQSLGGGASIAITVTQSINVGSEILTATVQKSIGGGAAIIQSATKSPSVAAVISQYTTISIGAGLVVIERIGLPLAAGAHIRAISRPSIAAAASISPIVTAVQPVAAGAHIAITTMGSVAGGASTATAANAVAAAAATILAIAKASIGAGAATFVPNVTVPLNAASVISQGVVGPSLASGAQVSITTQEGLAAIAALGALGVDTLEAAALLTVTQRPTLGANATIITTPLKSVGAAAEISLLPFLTLDAGAAIVTQGTPSLSAASVILVTPTPPELNAAAVIQATITQSIGAGASPQNLVGMPLPAGATLAELQYASLDTHALISFTVSGPETEMYGAAIIGGVGTQSAGAGAVMLAAVVGVPDPIAAASQISATGIEPIEADATVIAIAMDAAGAQAIISGEISAQVLAEAVVAATLTSPFDAASAISATGLANVDGGATTSAGGAQSLGAAAHISESGQANVGTGAVVQAIIASALAAGATIDGIAQAGLGAGATIQEIGQPGQISAQAVITATIADAIGAAAWLAHPGYYGIGAKANITGAIPPANPVTLRQALTAHARITASASASAGAAGYVTRQGGPSIGAGARISATGPAGGLHLSGGAYIVIFRRTAAGAAAVVRTGASAHLGAGATIAPAPPPPGTKLREAIGAGARIVIERHSSIGAGARIAPH